MLQAGILLIDSKVEGKALLNGVFGGGLLSRVDRSGDTMDIQLRVPERRGLLSWQYPWSWGSASVLDWTFHLSDQIPLALEIEISSGIGTLELGSLWITDLKIKANASETQIFLPDREGHTTVNIESRSAAVEILVPPDVAVTIHSEGDMVGDQIDLARFPLIEGGQEYRSEHYETALKRVDIHIDNSSSAIKIV